MLLELPLAEADEAVRLALGSEGFGVLTHIDVAATLRTKLGVERAPLEILGACNPAIADRALEIEPGAALVMPCNVVLESQGPGSTLVSFADPMSMLPSRPDGEDAGKLADVAAEAVARLHRVVSALVASAEGRPAQA